MCQRKNIWPRPTIVIIILHVLCSNRAVCGIEIFKCCDSLDNVNKTPEVNVSTKYLFSNETSRNLTVGNHLSDITLHATICHTDQSSLTSVVSIRPNNSDSELDQVFYETGYFRSGNQLFAPNQYCIQSVGDDHGYLVKTQPPSFCDENKCMRKCCGPLEVYDLSTYGISRLQCVPSLHNPWHPTFYHGAGKEDDTFPSAYFKSEHPRSWCNSDNVVLWSLRTIRNERRSLFRILKNGSILIKDKNDWRTMNNSKICVDGALNIPGYSYEYAKGSFVHNWNELDTVIIECGPDLAEPSDAPVLIYGIAMCISLIFLLTTLVVNCLLWEKQNIHGWTLMGYVTTMLLFYSSLLATFFHVYKYPDPGYVTEAEILNSFCGIIAVVSHFLYICAFCWLFVISTDIFLTFRILKLTRTRSKHKMKFFIYLFTTIFIPFIIVFVGVSLDLKFGDNLDANIILPRYGWNKCFLDLRKAALPYLFAPIGVLLALNCVMYLATIFHMYQIQESTKFASANNSQVQKQRAKIRLFSKLFVLMGVNWLLEVITFLVFGTEANAAVIVMDLVDILQPIAIFVIFVCKRDILKSLGEKYSFVSKVFSSVEPEESITSSSSGTRLPKFGRLRNPAPTTKWFRCRMNSTATETSNLSNQSIKSTVSINAIEESPIPISSSPAPTEELE